MTVFPRVMKASPEDNCTYRVEFTVNQGETMQAGNWFAWANGAQLASGPGWESSRMMTIDTYAKADPKVKAQEGYPILVDGHEGHHWLKLVPQGTDWRVKMSLGEPLPAGRYMVRVISRKSNFGDGQYLSGCIEPWKEMVVPEMSADDYRMAQVTANATGGPVEVATSVVEPIGSTEAQQKRIADLKAQLKAAEVQESVDAAFPELTKQPSSQAANLPF